MTYYIAIDLETSGLVPSANYIAEIAAVVFLDSGEILHTWETLVGIPFFRDNGGQWNNIPLMASYAAPLWRDVAPVIAANLEGAVVVGHNVDAFDLPFLQHALGRVGITLTVAGTVDTLTRDRLLRPDVDGVKVRHTLGAACEAYGIPLVGAHRAMADTMATVKLALAQGL